jgi:hypothetical protein
MVGSLHCSNSAHLETERENLVKRVIAFLLLSVGMLMAQKPEFLAGLGQGYDGEWTHASRQLVALAEAILPEKFSWRPAPGVRSKPSP